MAAAIPHIISTAGEDFAATVDGRQYSKRPEAVAAISEWMRSNTPEYGNYFRMQQEYGVVATLGGHDLEVRNAAGDSRLGSYQDLAITIKGVPAPPLVFSRTELLEGSIGIVTRLENKVAGLPDYEGPAATDRRREKSGSGGRREPGRKTVQVRGQTQSGASEVR